MSKEVQKWVSQDGKVLSILKDHSRTQSGNFNGVCVSAILSYFGINPNDYKFTSNSRTGKGSYLNTLRRFKYNVRSRKSVFKCKYGVSTFKQLKKEIAKSDYDNSVNNVYYLAHVWQKGKKSSHVTLLDNKGNIVCDTAPSCTNRRNCKVLEVSAIFLE